MSRAIIRDGNEGEVQLKRLNRPVKTNVITERTRVDDAGEDDVSGLNDDPVRERPNSSREVARPVKKPSTLIGNMGPDANGKINWSENEDCVSSILQYHETYGFENTKEGFQQTADKCWRQFNKLFMAKVTAEEIALALEKSYGSDAKPVRPKPAVSAAPENTPKTPEKPPEKEEVYFPIESRALEILSDKVILDGPKFEICKILNCPNICLMQRKKGPSAGNKVFLSACKNSKDGKIQSEGCPQEQKLSEKEQFLLTYTTSQFGGDELQAKKFLYLSRSLREK